jgi:GT2 family glycosyltransferase
MNQALAGTAAPVLVALNPDTTTSPGSLRRLVETPDRHPEIGVAVPRLVNDDGSLQHSVHRFPSSVQALVMGLVPFRLRRGWLGRRFWLEGYADFEHAATVDWAIGAVHAIRRSALSDPDRAYSERWFMYAEDMELCWRLGRQGWAVRLVPDAQVAHVYNAAGAATWGDTRDARWLEATYDWYRSVRGDLRTRGWAAANVAGLLVKIAVLRLRGDQDQAAAALRRLLALHRSKLARPAAPLR